MTAEQRELKALVKAWARIWCLPRGCWGAIAEAAYERASELAKRVEAK